VSEHRTTITLSSNAPPERLAAMTRDFSRDLTRAGVPSTLPSAPVAPGARGDAVAIGEIALALVTSGAVTALIDCFKAYLARERSLVVKVTRADGSIFEVNARNVNDAATKQALAVISPS